MSEAEVITNESMQAQIDGLQGELTASQEQYTQLRTVMDSTTRMPGSDASDEDWTSFSDKIAGNERLNLMTRPDLTDPNVMAKYNLERGVPEESSGYEDFEMHGVEIDEERMSMLKSAAKGANMSKKEYSSFLSKLMEGDAARNLASMEAHSSAVSAVKGEWGDAVDQKLSRIDTLLAGIDEKAGLRDSLKAGTLPASMLKVLDSLAESIGSESSPLTQELNLVTSPDNDEKRAQWHEIQNKIRTMKVGDPMRQNMIDKGVRLGQSIEGGLN